MKACKVSVLFARADSVYKDMEGVDVYDLKRNATSFVGDMPVVAHPPCRAWGQLRAFSKPLAGEKDLAFFALEKVRENGGVLEHPKNSTFWQAASLPPPGCVDKFGGFTLPVMQCWWGHKAEKATFLYIVGCSRTGIPILPLSLERPSHICGGGRIKRDQIGWRPEITKSEREHTPKLFAEWLIELATYCDKKYIKGIG